MSISKSFTDAVGYWEPKRILYNLILFALVMICWGEDIISTRPGEWLGVAAVLFFFAVFANLLYCAAYPIDVALQMSPLRDIWTHTRWMLFAAGTTLAGVLAVWVMLAPGMA